MICKQEYLKCRNDIIYFIDNYIKPNKDNLFDSIIKHMDENEVSVLLRFKGYHVDYLYAFFVHKLIFNENYYIYIKKPNLSSYIMMLNKITDKLFDLKDIFDLKIDRKQTDLKVNNNRVGKNIKGYKADLVYMNTYNIYADYTIIGNNKKYIIDSRYNHNPLKNTKGVDTFLYQFVRNFPTMEINWADVYDYDFKQKMLKRISKEEFTRDFEHYNLNKVKSRKIKLKELCLKKQD
jgi:hypothetical protein